MSQQIKYLLAYKMQAVNLNDQNGSKAEVARFFGICPSWVDLWGPQYFLDDAKA